MHKKRNLSFVDSIKEGIFQSIKKDNSVYLMGEGVDDPSSMWGTIKGARKKFGKSIAIEMPVAENGLIGIAIGSAISGERPIVNLQRVEFSLLALEQIINNAAKSSYISQGKHSVPIVIRLVIGRGWGQGPEHAQSLEGLFSQIPGLKVVIPSFPSDAKGLIISSIKDNNPIIFIEHRWLHFAQGEVAEKYYIEPLSSFKKIHSGKDVTIVSSSINTLDALRVAKFFSKFGIKIDLLDFRVPRPLEKKIFINSIKKTKRLITIDLGHKLFGVNAELISSATEMGINFKSPPIRLGLPDYPTPSSRGLIKNYYPDDISIIKALGKVLNIKKDKYNRIVSSYKSFNKKLPIDVPDPYFKGPF